VSGFFDLLRIGASCIAARVGKSRFLAAQHCEL
jgi:hypothetical protein